MSATLDREPDDCARDGEKPVGTGQQINGKNPEGAIGRDANPKK